MSVSILDVPIDTGQAAQEKGDYGYTAFAPVFVKGECYTEAITSSHNCAWTKRYSM